MFQDCRRLAREKTAQARRPGSFQVAPFPLSLGNVESSLAAQRRHSMVPLANERWRVCLISNDLFEVRSGLHEGCMYSAMVKEHLAHCFVPTTCAAAMLHLMLQGAGFQPSCTSEFTAARRDLLSYLSSTCRQVYDLEDRAALGQFILDRLAFYLDDGRGF